MKKNIVAIFLLFTLSFIGQEIKFVNAPNGLIIRSKPDKNAKRLGKFSRNSKVLVINETKKTLSVVDDGKTINGKWVEMEDTIQNLKGYVFDGFLADKVPNKGASSGNYYLTKIDSITLNEYQKNISKNKTEKPSFIYLRNNSHTDLSKFPISDLEFYEGTFLTVTKESGLKNILEVIKIESSYSACCSNTDEYYYLVNREYDLISLKKIENNHCDGPEPFFSYLFPNDKNGKNGKKDKIIYAKVIPKENTDDTIEVIKTFTWDGVQLSSE